MNKAGKRNIPDAYFKWVATSEDDEFFVVVNGNYKVYKKDGGYTSNDVGRYENGSFRPYQGVSYVATYAISAFPDVNREYYTEVTPQAAFSMGLIDAERLKWYPNQRDAA